MASNEELIRDLSPERLKELARLIRQKLGAFERNFKSERRRRRLSGIDFKPGVCDGVARIIRTRIPIWTLEQMRRLGMSESEILSSFPILRAMDLVHAWAYVDAHRAEINDQIAVNEQE